ncbi:hypothetical protein AAC387_Pa08g1426 [Persea americana]
MARHLLVDARKGEENKKVASPSKGTCRKHLAEATMMDRTRILSFWRKPPAPTNDNFKEENVLSNPVKSSQQQRFIPKSPDRTLDALELIDDYYMKLLDWSTRNVVAITLKNTVYLWNASKGSSSELLTVDGENGPCNESENLARRASRLSGFAFLEQSYSHNGRIRFHDS